MIETNEWGKRCVASGASVRCDGGGDDSVGDDDCLHGGDEGEVGDGAGTTLFYMPHCPMRLYSNVLWANWHPNLLLRRHHHRHKTHHSHSRQQQQHRHDNNIIIFGNSLRAYDDRLSSVLQRRDDTDGILPLLPWIREEKPVAVVSGNNASSVGLECDDFQQQQRYRRRRRATTTTTVNGNSIADNIGGGGGCRYELSEQGLETAFNDCVLVYFSEGEDQKENGVGVGVGVGAGNNDDGVVRVWPDRPREHIVTIDGNDELL